MHKSGVIISILAVYGLVVVSQLYLPVPLLGQIAEQYGVSASATGLILTVFGISYATGFLIFGPLSDYLGRKTVMAPGLLALAFASMLVAIAPTFELVIGARIIQGFVAATLPPVVLAYLPEVLPERRRALGIACMSLAFLLAGLLGQLYGSALGTLSTAIWPLVGIYLVGAGLIWFLPETKYTTNKKLVDLFNIYRGVPELFKNGTLVRAYAAALVLLFAFVAFYTALELFTGETIAQAGINLTIVRAIAVPAMFASLLAAHFIRVYGPRLAVCTGFTIGAIGLFIAAFTITLNTTVWLTIIASVIFVAGVSSTVPSIITLIGTLAPHKRGLAIGMYTFILFIGASLGPPLIPLMEPLGFGGLCLLLGGLFAVAAAINISEGQSMKPHTESVT